MFTDNLTAVADLIEVTEVRTVVDLGAGSGAGSRLLRRRYPGATVTCVDNDPQMLEALREQGFAAVHADLDDGFPAVPVGSGTVPAPVDLVWASSALHHVTDPAGLLSGVRRVLSPGGVLVVVELAGLPRFLTTPTGISLEDRCHAAAAAAGWNRHPDWTPVIEAAGFVVTRSVVTTSAPDTADAREYAAQWFARFAQLPGLTAHDRTAIDRMRHELSTTTELTPRTTRTVWVARPDPHSHQQPDTRPGQNQDQP